MNKKALKPAVILVADRTLAGDYKVLFEGIFASMQTTRVPAIVMRKLLSPPIGLDSEGRARTAVIGLRRIESALLANHGLSRNDVVCTTPEGLAKLLGPWVKTILFSSSDPLGQGMSNTTTSSFWKGELYTRRWTRNLAAQWKTAKTKFGFKVVAGGAGAWQLRANPEARRELGIDLLFEGYFERAGPGIIKDLLDGREAIDYRETTTCTELISPLTGASTMGVVELSRGCGRGCVFCTMADHPMEHLEPQVILADLERNQAAGLTAMVSGSEDFFRYGGLGWKVDFAKLAQLLEEMRQVADPRLIQIDHANLNSVLQFEDSQLRQIRRLLQSGKNEFPTWVNMGIESANGHLVQANCPGKLKPLAANNWEEHIKEATDKMCRCGFFPVFSIILGLPGETPEDLERTRKLVDWIAGRSAVVFPIFHEPINHDEQSPPAPRFTLNQMTRQHLALYQACYEINFKQVPRLFWANQRSAGVNLARRSLLRLLGLAEVHAWRRAFKRIDRQL